jgi:hypothetical protein
MANISFNMRSVVTYQEVLRSCVLIDEIWIEYVEFVTLDNLWGRIVHIVVGLIILVPFKTSVNPATETKHEFDGRCIPCHGWSTSFNLKRGIVLGPVSAANNLMSFFLYRLLM